MRTLNFTKNEEVILNFLADYPSQSFFSAEIARKNKLSLGGTHNALRQLHGKGMVKVEIRGRMRFWRINEANFVVKQYRAAYLINKLDEFIKTLKKAAIDVIIFGSVARGEYSKDSDIDILIISNNKNETLKIIEKYKRKFPTKAIIKTPNEWHELETKEPEFYQEVKRGFRL